MAIAGSRSARTCPAPPSVTSTSTLIPTRTTWSSARTAAASGFRRHHTASPDRCQRPGHRFLRRLSFQTRGCHSRPHQQQLGSALLRGSAPCGQCALWCDRRLLPQPATQRAHSAPGYDSSGNLVRIMTSTLPPPIEGAAYPYYWLAAPKTRALSTHVGLNRINLEPAI